MYSVLNVFLFGQMFILFGSKVKSEDCWDGVNSMAYSGKVAVTASGIECQAWSKDKPHTHGYHDPVNFPHDGSDVAAQNYCRDPILGPEGFPNCFTMSTRRWEGCDIPICSNLPCNGVTAMSVGQEEPAKYEFNSTLKGVQVILKHADTQIPCCGTIREWRLAVGQTGTLTFQVWRVNATDSQSLILVGKNEASLIEGINTVNIRTNDRISVMEGDYIGFHAVEFEMVPFSEATVTSAWTAIYNTSLEVGNSVNFVNDGFLHGRIYSIGAMLGSSIAPYFTNEHDEITVFLNTALDDEIYLLEFTDDDPQDISTLVVTMEANDYFDLKNGKKVVLKNKLVNGSWSLQFEVKDRCGAIGKMTLDVRVNGFQPVEIVSLPSHVSMLATQLTRQMLHTLELKPKAGIFTCAIVSYVPERSTGNPFILQTESSKSSEQNRTEQSDFNIYVKDGAGLDVNSTSTYNVTVTCVDEYNMTGSGFLLISVQPNALPVFPDFQRSISVNTSIPVDTVIYVVDVRDDEQLTLKLTCDPSPCPFALNNDGEVRVTSDFPKAQTDFLWTFTADDSFASVTSPTVNVAITGINTPPSFVYLNNSAVVAEKSPIGLTDIKLLAIIDSNELNSFTVTFNPVLCANMFYLTDSLASSNVLVLNVNSELDYETDPTYCTLHVTLFDGLFTSDPCVLAVEIIDVDENPVWTDSAYVQTLTEVTSGTTVFTSLYGASDPEGTNVSYSISCGTDSGFLSVEKHAVVVTMATTFDLDAAGVEDYTMECNLTATDAASNMAAIPFTLRIEDANDNYPVFKKGSYTFEIYQGNTSIGSEVGKVTATDADISSPNNELTFSVSPTTDFYTTGDAIIHSKVDIGSLSGLTTFELTITATDGGEPPLSTTIPIVVVVIPDDLAIYTQTPISWSATNAVPVDQSVESTTSERFFSDKGGAGIFAVSLMTMLGVLAGVGFVAWKLLAGKLMPPTQNATTTDERKNPNGLSRLEEHSKPVSPGNDHLPTALMLTAHTSVRPSMVSMDVKTAWKY